ncbi:MAG: hypothetical protein KKD35_04455, partial [Elusimicrobia bacterium]|nr:hypothetical protein [Elusimicrobiota bacterium]
NSNDPVTFANGEMHILDTNKAPLKDKSGNIYAIMVCSLDIAKRLELMGQVFKSQKMEAMGVPR